MLWNKRARFLHTIGLFLCISLCVLLAFRSQDNIYGAVKNEKSVQSNISYDKKLFDRSYVHKINISIEQGKWNRMTTSAKEEYQQCDIEIDGEKISKVAIRPKGNTTLAVVKARESKRYGYKVKFDHYNKQKSYYGLDKLVLNGFCQDPTYMKEFLVYCMMADMEVPSPLVSYVYLSVNDEPLGIYLALEGVEDGFLNRNYQGVGNLYKPDGSDIDNFDFSKLIDKDASTFFADVLSGSSFSNVGENQRVDLISYFMTYIMDKMGVDTNDASLKYVDDNPNSYPHLFQKAVHKMKQEEKEQFVQIIKDINEQKNIESAVNMDEIERYFVVHNFVMNYDSYTSVFAHNYYLYENNGQVGMIPWDYNVAFGAFSIDTGMKTFNSMFSDVLILPNLVHGMENNKSMVNYPIDNPLFGVDQEERPLLDVMLNNQEYKEQYHEYFSKFIAQYFDSGYFEMLFQETHDMIKPYIEMDPTKFYSVPEFETASNELKKFCMLRAESIEGQLNGIIGSTQKAQEENADVLICADNLNLAETIDFKSYLEATGVDWDLVHNILKYDVPSDIKNADGKIDLSNIDYSKDLKEYIPSIVSIVFQTFLHSKSLKLLALKKIMPVILIYIAVLVSLLGYLQCKQVKRRKLLKHDEK